MLNKQESWYFDRRPKHMLAKLQYC